MDGVCKVKTFQFRIKDSTTKKKLDKIASAVNFVWNFCVEQQKWGRSRSRKFLSAYDFQKLTAGSSKELGLNSATIQMIGARMVESSIQHKRICRFRSYKRNLGWIPFRGDCIKIGEVIKFNGITFKFWNSRQIMGNIKSGSFSCDVLGNWYINVTTDYEAELYCGDGEVGIDLGSKEIATLSNGTKYDNPRYYRQLETKLGKAQRAGKKKQAKKISKKISNQRKDYLHKMTTEIANNNKLIVVGDIGSKKLARTKMAKSTHDASWGMIKTLLRYKAIEHGGECLVVNEANTTRVCHACGVISDNSPKGLSGLGIREWQCNDCGTNHDRDVNASRNILAIGRNSLANKQCNAA